MAPHPWSMVQPSGKQGFFCRVTFEPAEPPRPVWPAGPHQDQLRAMTLLGLPLRDQLLALEAQGARPVELAWLASVGAPHLIPGWERRPFLARLTALTRWTQETLASANEVVPHLLRCAAVPAEALREDPALPDRLGLIPRWLEPFLRMPRSLVFRPGVIQGPADLGRWFEGEVLDLVVEGPQDPFQLPEGLRIGERLHLSRLAGLRRLHVAEFTGLSSELTLDHCPDLEEVRGGSGLTWLRIRGCPRFRSLGLESLALHRLELEGCDGLEVLDLPGNPALWYPPDVTLRNCPALRTLRLEADRPLRVRDLVIDGCPSLTALPGGLTVTRKLKAPALRTGT